jgi:cytochrome c oxidase cbb3-type subunit 3
MRGLLLGAALLFVTACSGEKQQVTPAAQPVATSGIDARKLYTQNCAVCHGAEASGDSPLGSAYPDTDLRDDQWTHGGTKTDIVETITKGLPGTPMRGFQGMLSPEEIEAIADHLISLSR